MDISFERIASEHFLQILKLGKQGINVTDLHDTVMPLPLHEEYRLFSIHSVEGQLQFYFLHVSHIYLTYNFL